MALLLQAYLDGEADTLSASMVSQHLETCRMCRLEADAYNAIKTSLQLTETPTITLGPGAIERLRTFARDLTAREG